ncbi:ribosomal protein L4, partial [Tothia fuscella]
LTTLYAFPSLEPLQFLRYPPTHLNVPLRKDILHKAVIFEGDATRQGTASTKYRSEVHGSNRKIRPQKGTGRARLGNKKSPMLRGGGVAFGPHPRDFSTGLNQKVYDLAVRTALSYRYRKGELLIVDGLDIPENITSTDEAFWLKACFDTLRWGNGNGNSLVVSEADEEENRLVRVLNQNRNFGRGRGVGTVDVKNLLGMGRVVIERGALDALLGNHQSDLR